VLPPTWLQELAAVGDFLAGLSLFLALWIFLRDRRASDRAQVDELAAWGEAFSMRTAEQPFKVGTRVLLRNASNLPVEIVQVVFDVRSRWLVPDHAQLDKRVPAYKQVEAPRRSMSFGGIRVPPGDRHEQSDSLDLSDVMPLESGGLSPVRGIMCEVRIILLIDNAGRRWRIQPGRGGPARRWYEFQPRRR
jgi:hypothetical protein